MEVFTIENTDPDWIYEIPFWRRIQSSNDGPGKVRFRRAPFSRKADRKKIKSRRKQRLKSR